MGGCRCSYKNCPNTTKTRENLHFFHYPVKQKERCRIWIENANKPQFYDLDEDQLRNKVICETHFEDYYFPNIQKKRLLQGAVPTLDGDCDPPVVESSIKSTTNREDVQVRPANNDGTIFILEGNSLQPNFQSERVESYIYTTDGMVLPMDKCTSDVNDIYQVEVEGTSSKIKFEHDEISNSSETFDSKYENNSNSYVFHPSNGFEDKGSTFKSQPQQQQQEDVNMPESSNGIEAYRAMNNKFVRKIKQHSKDIAILKRMLKSQNTLRGKPSVATVINAVRRQVPSTLSTVVNLSFNCKSDLTDEDLDFFTDIYNTSPQVYEMLIEKYNWKLPSCEALQDLLNCKTNSEETTIFVENN